MRYSDGILLCTTFEGCKLKPYLDAVKVPTIGYGNTYYGDGTQVTMNDPPITQQTAMDLFAIIWRKFYLQVITLFPEGSVFVNNDEIDAMTSLAYNIGINAFKKSTLLKKLVAGDKIGAADQFLVWNKAGGKIMPGLTRRRKAERALFLSQDWKQYLRGK